MAFDCDPGATVQQPCVITLEPVTTRLDTPITRRFIPEANSLVQRGRNRDRDGKRRDIEPLGHNFDLWSIMTEALALALPDYPRADDAALNQTVFSKKG